MHKGLHPACRVLAFGAGQPQQCKDIHIKADTSKYSNQPLPMLAAMQSVKASPSRRIGGFCVRMAQLVMPGMMLQCADLSSVCNQALVRWPSFQRAAFEAMSQR